jgi:hypothetical protein
MWCEVSRYQHSSSSATQDIFREITGVFGEVLIILLLVSAVLTFLIRLFRKESLAIALTPLAMGAFLLFIRLLSKSSLFCTESSLLGQLDQSFDLAGAIFIGTFLLGIPVAATGYFFGLGARPLLSKAFSSYQEDSQVSINHHFEIAIIVSILISISLLTFAPVGAMVIFLCSGILVGLSVTQFSSSVGKRLTFNSIYAFIFTLSTAFIFNGLLRQ